MRQTATYQQPPSYEPDVYSPPPPRRRPTCWDPPAYWETPGQRPFHEVSAYDHPLPPNHNSGWNQPAPQPPCPATTTAHPTLAQLQQLLEACYRMESRLVAADRRIDNMLPPELPEPAQPYGSQIFGFGDLVQHLPPSGNSKASPGPSGLVPYDSLAPPQQSSTTPPPFALLPDTALEPPPPPSQDYHQPPQLSYQPPSPSPSPLIPDCDRVEDGFADSSKKIHDSSVGFGGVEKVEKMERSSPDSARNEKPVQGCIEIQCSRQLVVASMNHRSTSLNADARLIPPRMERRCLSIRGCVDKIPVLALSYHDPALVIFYGDNEGRRSAVRCAFDPGGDRSRQAYVISDSLLCFFVFPP